MARLQPYHKQTETQRIQKLFDDRGGFASLMQDAVKAESDGKIKEFLDTLTLRLTMTGSIHLRSFIVGLLHAK